jgi:aminoglycoside phosphotransferase (APT) family kinase protein
LHRDAGIILLEAVRWSPRRSPWILPADVAFVLGGAFAASANDHHSRFSHGDVAPWNLLRTSDGWVLLDWESARTGTPAFYDLWHYVVQAHALLGRPARQELTAEGSAPDWLRAAVRAYASGAGSSEVPWRASLVEYLRVSMHGLDPADREQARALRTKVGLLDALSARGGG